MGTETPIVTTFATMKNHRLFLIVALLVCASAMYDSWDAIPVSENKEAAPATDFEEVSRIHEIVPEVAALQEASQVHHSKRFKAKCSKKLLKKGGVRTFCTKGSIGYVITKPKHCTKKSKCGIILNIHGGDPSMKNPKRVAGLEQQQMGLAKAALKGKKYIVINPDHPKYWWNQKDAAKIVSMLKLTMKALGGIVNKRRIHSAGFSQGGMTSWNILCLASDTICSISALGGAPNGLQRPLGPHGLMPFVHTDPLARNTCWTGKGRKGPATPRSAMLQIGRHDPIVSMGPGRHTFAKSVALVKKSYGMKGKGKKIKAGMGVDWTRYSKGSINFEAVEYPYVNMNYRVGGLWGHCAPTKGVAHPHTRAHCGAALFGAVSEYSWGDKTIEFFEKNPCLAKKGKGKGKKLKAKLLKKMKKLKAKLHKIAKHKGKKGKGKGKGWHWVV